MYNKVLGLLMAVLEVRECVNITYRRFWDSLGMV